MNKAFFLLSTKLIWFQAILMQTRYVIRWCLRCWAVQISSSSDLFFLTPFFIIQTHKKGCISLLEFGKNHKVWSHFSIPWHAHTYILSDCHQVLSPGYIFTNWFHSSELKNETSYDFEFIIYLFYVTINLKNGYNGYNENYACIDFFQEWCIIFTRDVTTAYSVCFHCIFN